MQKLLYALIILLAFSCQLWSQSSGPGPFTLSTPTGATSIQWYKDGTAISGETSATYAASAEGVYWVAYDNTDGCSVNSGISIISTEDNTVQTTFNAPTGATNMIWSKDDTPISGANSAALAVNNAAASVGKYTLAYDNSSCTITTDSMMLYMLESVCTDIDKYAANCDYDGDGINNDIDIDDDNDGVLDIQENCSANHTMDSNNNLDIAGVLQNVAFTFFSSTSGAGGESLIAVNFSANPEDFVPAESNVGGASVGGDDGGTLTLNSSVSNVRMLIQGLHGANEWTFDQPFQIIASGGTSPVIQSPANTLKLANATDTDGNVTIEFTAPITTVSYTSNAGDNTDVVQLAFYACSMDTDGDGIVNGFDLDSDGDGCYDAYEAGVTGATNGGTAFTDSLVIADGVTAGVGDNGYSDALEDVDTDAAVSQYTSTYDTYATDQFLVKCLDTDNDGVEDFIDLDDDNDGVLDAAELGSTNLVSWLQSFSDVITIHDASIINQGTTITGGPSLNLTTFNGFYQFSGASTSDLADAQANGNWIEGTFATTGNLSDSILAITGISHVTRGNVAFDYAFAISDDNFTTETILTRNQSHYTSAPILEQKYYIKPNTSYGIRVYTYSSASGGGHRFDDLRIITNGYRDTDADGIANHLDLDSDGDGCYDSYEATVTNATNNATPTDSITAGPYGNNGFGDAIETAAESGLHNGTYTYASAIDNTTNPCNSNILVSPIVILQGAYIAAEDMMQDSLRSKGFLPIADPYAAMSSFTHVLDGGGETVAATLFNATGNTAIVDWVFVELRDKTTNTTVVATQAALLQRDGEVVNTAGSTSLEFDLAPDDYYVVVRHRNHLSVMTATPIALSSTTTEIDFTDDTTPTYGTHGRKIFTGGVAALWAGDTNQDNKIVYVGNGTDYTAISSLTLTDAGNQQIFSDSHPVSGYQLTDVDLNGVTIYAGSGTDQTLISSNALLHPGNSTAFSNSEPIIGQVPYP